MREFGGTETNDLLEVVKENTLEDYEPQFMNPSIYIDLDTIENYIKQNKNTFSIFSVNIQSLNAKFNELTVLVEYLREKFHFQFSAICLQECWIEENTDTSQLKISNYEILAKGNECCKHGGLVTYIHKDFKGKQIKTHYKKSAKKLWEGQHIVVTGDR